MSTEYSETILENIDGNDYFGVSTGSLSWKNQLAKLAEKHPDQVICIADNEDGVFYHVPKAWVKIRPPKQMNFTEEQIEEKRERMRQIRAAQKAK